MIRLILFNILILATLNANEDINAKKFCDELLLTKNYLKSQPTLTAHKIIEYADGGISVTNTIKFNKRHKNSDSYHAGSQCINDVLIESCKYTNQLINNTKASYFSLLHSRIVKAIRDRKY